MCDLDDNYIGLSVFEDVLKWRYRMYLANVIGGIIISNEIKIAFYNDKNKIRSIF